MPIRIYALAKELDIENKDLVDICTKAGITGKGSALASLTDEEIVRVKSFLGGGKSESKGASESAARTNAAAARTNTAAAQLGSGTATATAPPKSTARRDDALMPRKTSGRMRVLDAKAKRPPAETQVADAESDNIKSPPPKREQVVRLAQMPDIKQPPPKAKAEEPKIQKPDIALPKDAIVGARKGQAAPLKQFTESQKKTKVTPTKKPRGKDDAEVEDVPLTKLGKGGRRVKAKEPVLDPSDAGMGNIRDHRTQKRKTTTKPPSGFAGEETGRPRRLRPRARKGQAKNTAAPRKENVVLELPCSVRTFSEAAGTPVVKLCFSLAGILGITPNMLNINTRIDEEVAHLLAEELGVELNFKQHESLEDTLIDEVMRQDDDPSLLEPRAPVVTFLGHVDHGKTSLLDRLIGINVVSGEAGGITQHIRAYEIETNGRKISFVDTPGHEAFTEMRARGANVTDIAVLVVAADDGVMPQTEEAISHARAAGVPIVVALNKIDLPGVDPNKALQDLAAHDLLPSEWGGEVEVVRTSAITGEGLDSLLETLLVTAELHEYKANPNRPANGTCLEAEQEAGRGVIVKLIVQNGTLNVGDVIVCGTTYGRVKAMHDTLRGGKKVKKAGPSTPVNVTGLDAAPQAGDAFYVLDDITKAREVAEYRETHLRERSLSGITTKVSFEDFQRRLEEGRLGQSSEVVTLNLIIRADVRGSIEAIQKELGKLEHPEVQVKVLQASVGGITVADVTLAHASHAVIVGFNVIPDESARSLAEERGVEIRRYDIIYKVTEDIKLLLEGKLKPEKREVELGRAMVLRTFSISRSGMVAGCRVLKGTIERGSRIRVNRDSRTIGEYALESLKREKDDVREVKQGMECGIKLAGFNDVKEADILEAYKIEEFARTL